MSKPGSPRSRQRGDILLEALIGVLVAALIGGAMAHLLARTLDEQRQATLMRLVLDGMDRQLTENGVQLCGTSPALTLPVLGKKSLTVACPEVPNLSVSLGGSPYTVTPPKAVTLSVAAADLGLDGDVALALGSQQ